MIEVNGERVDNIPNAITATRIVGSVWESYLYAKSGDLSHYVRAVAWYGADVFDGPAARLFNQETDFGAQFDPVGDKISVAGLTIAAVAQENIDTPVVAAVGSINSANALITIYTKSIGIDLKIDNVNKYAQLLMNSGAGLNVLGNHYRKQGSTPKQRVAGNLLRIIGGSVAVGSAITLGAISTANLIKQTQQGTATITTE